MNFNNFKVINEAAKKYITEGGPIIDSVNGPITKDELEEWLEDLAVDVDNYEVVNGVLNVGEDLSIADEHYEICPVPLGDIKGSFNASNDVLTSFKNFPSRVSEHLFCYDVKVKSFDGLLIEVGGNVDLDMNHYLENFTGVHRHIRKMGGVFKFDLEYVRTGGLGIMLIPGVRAIESNNRDLDKIVNKYIKGGDVFDCQEALIDAGFATFARV